MPQRCTRLEALLIAVAIWPLPTVYGHHPSAFQEWPMRQRPALSTASNESILLLRRHRRDRLALAFAAPSSGSGQGFGRQKSTTVDPSSRSKNKRETEHLEANLPPLSSPSPKTSSPSPKKNLDKWGLPPPTLDDIFPQLDAATQSTLCAATKDGYTLSEIQQALVDYLPLSLSERFDESGVERTRLGDDKDETLREKMQLRLLHVSPPVLVIDNFLTPDECQEIQALAATNDIDNPALGLQSTSNQPSSSSLPPPVMQVAKSATFLQQNSLSVRTSTSWFCRYDRVPILLAKAHHVLGINVKCLEEPQIVRYRPGQEFSWHYDVVPATTTLLQNGGQRLATLLVYLNTVPINAGGGTVFRDLVDTSSATHPSATATTTPEPLCVQPVRGRALLFFPAHANGQPDYRTLHKGAPMQSTGIPTTDSSKRSRSKKASHPAAASTTSTEASNEMEKWIVQAWIHERSYQASLPSVDNVQDDEATSQAVTAASRRLGYEG